MSSKPLSIVIIGWRKAGGRRRSDLRYVPIQGHLKVHTQSAKSRSDLELISPNPVILWKKKGRHKKIKPFI